MLTRVDDGDGRTQPRAETRRPVFPFSAIVGQEEMKRALMISAVDPDIGGVLILGDRGTGKSTAVRALAALLPDRRVVAGCPYGCAPDDDDGRCEACAKAGRKALPVARASIPVVDLPLGATEDRLVGALDIERALTRGEKAFEPGLLARANGGYLYIDEVNLLEDHLVDLLLDVAASGRNVVEREGLSLSHPARFVLVGSGNPEEGELRPQLLDRFGLAVDVGTPSTIAERVEVVKRRQRFEADRAGFVAVWRKEENRLRRRIAAGRAALPGIDVPDQLLEKAAEICLAIGTDGLRGELTLTRAARAVAALEGRSVADLEHLRAIAPAALRHRLRRNVLDEVGSTARIEIALKEILG